MSGGCGTTQYRHLAMAPDGWTEPDCAGRRRTIEPTNPESLALVRGLLGELLAATSRTTGSCTSGSTSRGSCPPSASTTTSTGSRVLRALPELDGREMLIWGDILAGEPERLRALPDGVTVCEWGYDAGHPFDARAATLRGRAGSRSGSRPGTSSWLTILGRITNMRGEHPSKPSTPAIAHGGGGLLNTDWGDNGHLQYLPISEPGLAYGAAVAWCADDEPRPRSRARRCPPTATTTRRGVLGEALVALGDVYLGITPQMMQRLHARAPALLAAARRRSVAAEGREADEYAAVEARARAVSRTRWHARPTPARRRRPRARRAAQRDRARRRSSCRDGRPRVEGDGTPRVGRTRPNGPRLADDSDR